MIDCGNMRNNKSCKTISSITVLSLLISTAVLPSYAGIEGGVHARFDHEINGSLQNINAKGAGINSKPTSTPLSHAQEVPGGSTNASMTHVLLIGPGSREVASPRSSDTMAKSTGTQNRNSDDAAKSTELTKVQIQNKALEGEGQIIQEKNNTLLSGWQTTLKDTASSNIARREGELEAKKNQLSTSLSTHTLSPSNFSKLQTWSKNNRIIVTMPYNPYQEGPVLIISIGKFTVPVYGVSVTGAYIFTALHDYIPNYLQSHEKTIALKSLLFASSMKPSLSLRSSGLGLALKTSLENPDAIKSNTESQVFKQPVIFSPRATSDDGTLNFASIEDAMTAPDTDKISTPGFDQGLQAKNGAAQMLESIGGSLQQTANQIKQSQTTIGQFVHGANATDSATALQEDSSKADTVRNTVNNPDAMTASTTDKNGSVSFTSIMDEIGSFEAGKSASLKSTSQANINAIKEQASAAKGEASDLKTGAQPLLKSAAGDFAVSVASTAIAIEKEQLQSSKAQEPPEKTNSGQREEEKQLLATQVKSQIKSQVNVTNKSTSDMETAREYTLGTGSAFVANDKPMTVHTSVADITVPAKNGVFIVSVGDNVAVYNLTGGGAATVGIGTDKVIPLKHSDQLVLTKNTSASFDDINPGKDIKSQNVRDMGNYSGVRVFGADFNYESVLDNLPQLSTLLTSTNGHEQSIGQRLLKTTAVQEALESSN